MKRRHWKQRYDPDAEFVFLKRVKDGDTTYDFGDDVPKDRFASKLRIWFRAEVIGLKDFKTAREVQETEAQIVEKGQGWYDVVYRGEVHKARGRDEADDLAASLRLGDTGETEQVASA